MKFLFEREKGFIFNAKKILKRYPEAIKESWVPQRHFSLLAQCPEEDSIITRVLRTIFSVIFYFPFVLVAGGRELYTGIPTYETDFERLERLDRAGEKLTEEEREWLERHRRFWAIQRERIERFFPDYHKKEEGNGK